jgi:cytochrome c oxidase cbb3-type subunit 3
MSALPTLAGADNITPVENMELGRDIYNFRCYYCHGYSGDAKTLATTFLTPPPRDFTAIEPDESLAPQFADTVKHGRAGTAMKSFASVLSDDEISAVVGFVLSEFVAAKAPNTKYHTVENGWPDHERYQPAYGFATGELALDTPWDDLSAEQQMGKRLFLRSCVSCHDRARVNDEGPIWDLRPLSYPRNAYSHITGPTDAITSASTYAIHDRVPQVALTTQQQKYGEKLFQENCAFCHGADGTGRNWIGSFLEPHPRDLTNPAFMRNVSRAYLANAIRDGLANTSMPAWKSVLDQNQIEALLDYIDVAFHPIP